MTDRLTAGDKSSLEGSTNWCDRWVGEEEEEEEQEAQEGEKEEAKRVPALTVAQNSGRRDRSVNTRQRGGKNDLRPHTDQRSALRAGWKTTRAGREGRGDSQTQDMQHSSTARYGCGTRSSSHSQAFVLSSGGKCVCSVRLL